MKRQHLGIIAYGAILLLTISGGFAPAKAENRRPEWPLLSGPRQTYRVERVARADDVITNRNVNPYAFPQNRASGCSSLACPGFILLGVGF
jgi:hypothetical protein